MKKMQEQLKETKGGDGVGWDAWALRTQIVPDIIDKLDPEQAERRKSTERRIFQARWKWLQGG